jgi:hypothetical protein
MELTREGRKGLTCDPSQLAIAGAVGGACDRKTAKRITEKFAELGLLEITVGGAAHNNRTIYRGLLATAAQGAGVPLDCPLSETESPISSGGNPRPPQGAKSESSGGATRMRARDLEKGETREEEKHTVGAEAPGPDPGELSEQATEAKSSTALDGRPIAKQATNASREEPPPAAEGWTPMQDPRVVKAMEDLRAWMRSQRGTGEEADAWAARWSPGMTGEDYGRWFRAARVGWQEKIIGWFKAADHDARQVNATISASSSAGERVAT